jgi:hypothetical protein
MSSIINLQAINLAIWIRDNALKIDRNLLIEQIQNLAEYEIFSNRQLEAICKKRISYATIGGYTRKSTKSGGRLNPDTLEDLREVLFLKHNGRIAYSNIKNAVDNGTSQNMVSRLTGVAQSTISKHFGGN